jgi:translation initiation factor 2B subunit (eIF-2B alpha/beta/delta family)
MEGSIKIVIDLLENARLVLKDSVISVMEELEEAQNQLARMRMTSGTLGELAEVEIELNSISDYINRTRSYINKIEDLIDDMDQ